MKTKKYIKSLAIGLIKYVVTGFIVAFGILAFSNKEKSVTKASDKMKLVPTKIKIIKNKDQTLQSKKFYQQLNTNTVRI